MFFYSNGAKSQLSGMYDHLGEPSKIEKNLKSALLQLIANAPKCATPQSRIWTSSLLSWLTSSFIYASILLFTTFFFFLEVSSQRTFNSKEVLSLLEESYLFSFLACQYAFFVVLLKPLVLHALIVNVSDGYKSWQNWI